MQISPWLNILIFISFIVGVIALLSWMLFTTLDDLLAMKWRKLFEEDLRLAIKHSQPSWEQLADIAASRNIKNKDIFRVMQKLRREILTGRETDISTHLPVLEGYLDKLKEIEPFEGIPTEIRIHLERIKEQLTQYPLLLQPLTSQIRELLSVNEKDKRQQKYYTIGGFFVGFLGFVFAAFSYFYPYANNSPTPVITSPTHDSVTNENGTKFSNPSLPKDASQAVRP
jgi:hypothetical protein